MFISIIYRLQAQILRERIIIFIGGFVQNMQKEGKGRRKRKDPQSRDFSCLCGKSYLSYAAAYTHAKNKHEGDKQYIDGIIKPQREQLKRGRPKEKKPKAHSEQTARLTLVQSTILKICQQLQGAFSKCILQGNEERDTNQYQHLYRSLSEDLLGERHALEPYFAHDNFFLSALVKDFTSQVAARVKIAIVVLSRHEDSLQKGVSRLNELNGLWKGRRGINEAISSALSQWRRLSVSNNSQSQQGANHQDFDI